MTAFGFLAAYYGFGKMQQDIKPTLSLALEVRPPLATPLSSPCC